MKNIEAETVTHFTSTTAKGLAQIRTGQGGDGFGADIGFYTIWARQWQLALAMENVLGNIKWNRKPEVINAAFTVRPNTIEKIVSDDLDLDEVVISNDTTFSVPAFIERLPFTFRLGLQREFSRFSLAAEFSKSAKQSALTSKKPVFAVGAEYRPGSVLSLRAAIRLGDDMAPVGSAGLGLTIGQMRWDLAILPIAAVVPAGMKGLGLATGMVFKF